MSPDHERLFVLTGGPGSGKSTLIDALERAGYARSVETGRGIIQEQTAIEGRALPWRDPVLFAEMMLSWELRSYRMATERGGLVFFDRGIPDVAGYLRLLYVPVPEHVHKAAQTFRYNRHAFIAPPWPEIYTQDSERKQTLDEAVRTYEAMVETYTRYGYELITIPRAPIEERARFVIENATKTSGTD